MSAASASPLAAASMPIDSAAVGVPPSSPDASYFPESPYYRAYAQILFGIGAFFAVLGTLLTVTLGGPSWLFILLAPVFLIWGLNRRTHQMHFDCVADSESVTLRSAKGKTPLPPVSLPWQSIGQTQCGTMVVTQKTDGGDVNKEYLTFSLGAPDRPELRIDQTRIKNLPGLIALTNQRTPQLPYIWVPQAEATNRQVLGTAGKYCKVAR